MKIIKILPLNDANLDAVGYTSPYNQWDSGVNYALGDTVQVDSPFSTVTISNDSSAVPNSVAWTAHGLEDETPIIFSTTGTLPDGNPTYPAFGKIVAGRAYYVKNYQPTSNLYANYFQISETPRGPIKDIQGSQSGTHTATASTHIVYESLQGSNLNKVPRAASSSTWWLNRGSTNQYKRFDNSVSSQSRDVQIYTQVQLNEPADSLVLANISCSTISVVVTDAVDGVTYDVTHSGISTSGIDDFWSWFFTPIERVTGLVITNLPVSNDATLNVVMSEIVPEFSCLCGKFVVGLSLDAGGTGYGASIGFEDYSSKTENAWGDYEILEGNWAAKASFTTLIETGSVQRFLNLLIALRATPAVYIGEDDRLETMVIGWAKETSVVIEYEGHSLLNTDIHGLT